MQMSSGLALRILQLNIKNLSKTKHKIIAQRHNIHLMHLQESHILTAIEQIGRTILAWRIGPISSAQDPRYDWATNYAHSQMVDACTLSLSNFWDAIQVGGFKTWKHLEASKRTLDHSVSSAAWAPDNRWFQQHHTWKVPGKVGR